MPRVPLVEVVRGLATSDGTFQAALEFVRLMGKTGVEIFEYPGYVTTRVILPFLNEAMHVVMEGVATAEAVDTSMKLGYGLPVGPLALADRMGLDEVMRWMQHLFDELGDLKYRPCPLLRKMIRAGHLGVKSGKGFFEYDEHGQVTAVRHGSTSCSRPRERGRWMQTLSGIAGLTKSVSVSKGIAVTFRTCCGTSWPQG